MGMEAEGRPSPSQARAFAVLLAVAGFFFVWTISPIWVPMFLGVLVAVVAHPLQVRLERRLGGHPRLLAALITTLAVALGVGAVSFIGFVVVRELVRVVGDSGAHWAAGVVGWLESPRLARLLARLGQSPEHLVDALRGWTATLLGQLSTLLGGLLAVTSSSAVTVLLTGLTAYYLLCDGARLARFVLGTLPLPPSETRALMREFQATAVGIFVTVFGVSLSQALLAGLGLYALGVPRPLVWGALTFVTSLVPTVGTALLFVPLALVEMATGHVARGLAVLSLWLVVVVVFADYLLRPWLLRGQTRMPALLAFIAIFGGLGAFGPLGFALGPVFVSLFIALLRIYDRDYRSPAPTVPGVKISGANRLT
jgi:predicted PurR-regulated permease PerM